MNSTKLYDQAFSKAREIEAELKRLNRWTNEPLREERFENMGAFGADTMTFEQWLQFVLLVRIRSIVAMRGEFPEGSSVAPYAIRVFDGDNDAGHLHELLYDLDKLINEKEVSINEQETEESFQTIPKVSVGDRKIPDVIYKLIEVLPQFEGEDLESQLETYDTFLGILSPSVRPTIAKLLEDASQKTFNEKSRERILKAATSVANGGRAARLK
jgi:uncharacterized protein YqcC (DUF446 family)